MVDARTQLNLNGTNKEVDGTSQTGQEYAQIDVGRIHRRPRRRPRRRRRRRRQLFVCRPNFHLSLLEGTRVFLFISARLT